MGGDFSDTKTQVNKLEHEETNDLEHRQYAKQIVEMALKAVTPFEVDKARQDGTVVKTIFRNLQKAFKMMDLGMSARDERKKITLLKSKI